MTRSSESQLCFSARCGAAIRTRLSLSTARQRRSETTAMKPKSFAVALTLVAVFGAHLLTSTLAEEPRQGTTESIPQPTTATMRALAERIANGDQAALDELRDTAKKLYRDIDFNKEKERVVSNLVLMRAAFNVLGEEAGKGNDKAFQALKTCFGTSNLSSFAPDALGIAAAAGHKEALGILLNHDAWGILKSSAVFALRAPAEANIEPAVDFLIAVILNPNDRPLWHGASVGLVGAATKGNQKAKDALEKYADATRSEQ